MILYLSGAVREGLPAMITPNMGNLPPAGVPWAADNGRFSAPARYSDEKYLAWLARMEPYRERCLFATAPDVVGNAIQTLVMSRPMLSRIREAGYPAAFVAQDGLEKSVPPWDEFDALFVGGSTTWKLSEAAYAIVAEAKRRGKWTHMGRVNSLQRLRAAEAAGYDSADGTYVAFAPDLNEGRMRGWLDHIAARPTLWSVGLPSDE